MILSSQQSGFSDLLGKPLNIPYSGCSGGLGNVPFSQKTHAIIQGFSEKLRSLLLGESYF